MRTDVKLALVIALILVVVGLWFFVVRPTRQPAAPEPGDETATVDQGREPDERYAVDTGELPSGALTESVPPEESATTPEGPRTDTAGSTEEDVPIGYAPSPEKSTGTETAGRTDTEKPPAEKSPPWWLTSSGEGPRGEAERKTETAAKTVVQTGSIAPLKASAPETYKIKTGDSYWSIAKTEYGDATLYKLLVDANPNIPGNALQPGMTIKVPSRPVRTEETAPQTPVALDHGKTAIDGASKKRYYIVKTGDAGFWGISVAVYKTPKLWKRIEAANPGVDPSKLMPGRKVWLPEEEVVETAMRTPSRTATPGPVAARAMRLGWSGTGAPRRMALPDGRVFD